MKILRILFFVAVTSASVIQLDGGNLESTLKGNEIVFVNFYADWCRFSQQLKPIFLQASENFANHAAGRIVWASVDADKQPEIATKYHVNKYPTLKLFRNGEIVKKEYRSQRSVEALTAFVNKQLDSGLVTVQSPADLVQKMDSGRRNVVGVFPSLDGPAPDNFKKVASTLREECGFFIGSGVPFGQASRISFRSANNQQDEVFMGNMENLDALKAWATEKCIPLVREITFENAEELTEEGLPFLILFKHPDDKMSEKSFTDAVLREIPDQKTAVNCLVADGKRFAHPLHHLGKAEGDLPVIAIDSFRHMYLFPNTNDLNVPGKLRQFVLDLHSGKLHREFHHGPDAPEVTEAPELVNQAGETQPPPSVFEKLKPSGNRYTLLDKDEL